VALPSRILSLCAGVGGGFMNERICTKCKQGFPAATFRKHARGKDGLYSWCRDCSRACSNRYYMQESVEQKAGKCECCGETRQEFLAVDHIHGGGKADRARFSSSGSFYFWLIQQGFPRDKYRLLCHNCNTSIGLYGYCPHAQEVSREAV
jgi:hypothetical protein